MKATAKSAKAASSTSAVLTLRHLVERLSEAHELPKRQANEMLTQVVEMITRSLKKGEKVRLTGLGILQVRKRAARTGRNPQTNQSPSMSAVMTQRPSFLSTIRRGPAPLQTSALRAQAAPHSQATLVQPSGSWPSRAIGRML